MPIKDILWNDWQSEFDKFILRNTGMLASLDIIGLNRDAHIQAHNVVLEYLKAETKNNHHFISVAVALPPGEGLSRVINDVRHVWLHTTESGLHESLEIEAADGIKTVIAFEHVPQIVEHGYF